MQKLCGLDSREECIVGGLEERRGPSNVRSDQQRIIFRCVVIRLSFWGAVIAYVGAVTLKWPVARGVYACCSIL